MQKDISLPANRRKNSTETGSAFLLLTVMRAEVYMDGMGWVPVDVTPGFYYDTYALLNMAQSPGQVRKVAALDSEGEEAENLKKHFPGSEPFLENQKQTELKTADIGWGMILLILFVFGIYFCGIRTAENVL